MLLTVLSFALPAVMLVLGIVWTRRLVVDPEVTWPLPRRCDAGVKAAAVFALATVPPCVAFVLLVLLRWRSAVWEVGAVAWLGLGLAWIVASLARRRLAARAVVANAVVIIGTLGLFLVVFRTSLRDSHVLPHTVAGLLLVPVLVYAAWATRPLTRLWPLTLLVFLPLGLMLGNALWPTLRPDVEIGDAVDWVETFDASTDDLLAWEDLGRTANWLRDRGIDVGTSEAAAARVRREIREGVDLHPMTLVGAFDAGLLRPEDMQRACEARIVQDGRDLLEGEGPFVLSILEPPAIRMLLGGGTLAPDERARLADRLAASWPEDPGSWTLEDAFELSRLLALAGAGARVADHREALRDLLRRTYVRTPPAYQSPGGFSPFQATREASWANAEATWEALEIARLVGVPEGVDLGPTATFLYEASRPYDWGIDGGPALDSMKRDEQLAWLRLRTEHDARAPSLMQPGSLAVLAAAAAFALLALWVLARSPRARIVRRPTDGLTVPQTLDRMAKQVGRPLRRS